MPPPIPEQTRERCEFCKSTHPVSEGIIHYERDFECHRCGESWHDVWCADCDDECPYCTATNQSPGADKQWVIVEPVVSSGFAGPTLSTSGSPSNV